MKQTYATPAQVGTNVRSVTHNWFGALAVIPLDQIRVAPRRQVRFGGAHPLAAPQALDASRPHRPGHLVSAHVVADPTRRLPQLANP
jgi:hypothetical protein